jgi:nitroimidazol reductase NimA-like FMN-containing flavoprotein (pyridoxamine 5'-phosphate oxidase superfamily)
MSKSTNKIKVKRSPKRGFYDKETIYNILDKNFICQVAFIYDNYPVIIPTIYGRFKNYIYLHGAPVSRMLQTLEKGKPISINVTQTDGIVLARSTFHHSLNYQSVTIFGCAEVVNDASERLKALEIISNQIIPNRWEEARLPNKNELKATMILKIEISEASAKIRKGPPVDDKKDYKLPIWAGVLPINKTYGKPIPDENLSKEIPLPQSVKNLLNNE